MNSSSNDESKTPSSEVPQFRLWINDEWYIPVDDNGQCKGPCAEGALGFIVRLSHERDPDKGLALKLPRFMAETHRENAYISDLMEKEMAAVFDVFLQEETNTEGLLTPFKLAGRGGPMRGERDTRGGPPDAKKLHDSIVLVYFEKGQNPRFCLVKSNSDETLTYFPNITEKPINTAEDFERLKRSATGDGYSWTKTVMVDTGVEWKNNEIDGDSEGLGQKNNDAGLERDSNKSGDRENTHDITSSDHKDNESSVIIFNKDQALDKDPTGKTWYTCIPSVAYLWAPGTLQEAISLGKRGGTWGVNKHIALVRRLCEGLYTLHSNGMLHADLRPANVAYRGNPRDPNNYFLSDYGSFAETGARVSQRSRTGDTVLGPVVGTERVSPFYALERRAGREREAADTAIIVKCEGGTTLHIILGWRSKLLTKEGTKLSVDVPSIIEKFNKLVTDAPWENSSRPPVGIPSTNALSHGDRIQIREYIFDVINAADMDDMQVLECNERVWKIYHGRIVVRNFDHISDTGFFPIPRTVELLQWSAATDLYSLGAIALYSVYRDEKPHVGTSNVQVEEDFRRMLSYLESEPYFNSIWPELDWFTAQLEKNLTHHSHLSLTEFSALPFERRDNDEFNHKDTLKAEAVALVGRITQTVPGIHRLVDVFSFKLGAFIFYIHFVLCCLHRTSHLKKPGFWLIRAGDLKNPVNLAVKLRESEDPVSVYIRTQLSPDTQRLLKEHNGSPQLSQPLQRALIDDLNSILKSSSLFEEQRFAQVEIRDETRTLVGANLGPEEMVRFNRLLLEDTYSHEISNGWNLLPFCADRCDPPRDSGGAKLALDRLLTITRLIDKDNLDALDPLNFNEIPEFDPRPDPEIRVQMQKLSRKVDETIEEGLSIIAEAKLPPWDLTKNIAALRKIDRLLLHTGKALKESRSPAASTANEKLGPPADNR